MEEKTAPSTIKEKEIYQLWWNYLKLSENYAEYCRWRQEQLSDPELGLPEKFVLLKDDVNVHPFLFIYEIFQDPWVKEQEGQPFGFDVWWKRNKAFLSNITGQTNSEPVRNYSEWVRQEMNTVASRLKRQGGKKLTLGAFIDQFVRHMTESMPPKLLVEIDVTVDEMGPLLKKINEWLLVARESPKLQHWKRFTDRTNWPASRKGLALLKRYLIVYDLHKKGLKMEQIVMKVGTATQRTQYSDASIKGVFEEDLAKARAIIKNVEQGTFPGFYGKYTRF